MATTIRAMLNTDRKSASGYYPLVIRVIHNRRKKLIYSSFKFREEDFDIQTEKVSWSEAGLYTAVQIKEINRYIETQKLQLERVTRSLHKHRDGLFTVADITVKYTKNKKYRHLFTYIDKEIENKCNTQRFGPAILFRTTKASIKRFTKGRDVLLRDITYTFVCDYINHLRERGLEENTIHMYLRNFRSIYNKARKEGLVSVKTSPFEEIKMNGTTTVKRAISKEMMRKIAHADFSSDKEMDQVRDIFLFSYYTRGMSMIDLLYLKHSDIKGGVIYYSRNKTKQNIEIAVTEPLQKLIDKYRSNSIYILPYLCSSSKETLYSQYRNALTRINRYLKRIGTFIGLDTPLTTYVARHSWATIAKSEGAPIAAISEGLGHTTEKTTQIYLKAFDRSVIDEVNAKLVVL